MNPRNTKVSNAALGEWRIDPDRRQDRGSGPVTVSHMTPEEIEKQYGHIEGVGKKPFVPQWGSKRIDQEEEDKVVKKTIHIDELNDEIKKKVMVAAQVPTKISKVEVRRLAEEASEDWNHRHAEYADAIKLGIEKQIPKVPDKIHKVYTTNVRAAYCPGCGQATIGGDLDANSKV